MHVAKKGSETVAGPEAAAAAGTGTLSFPCLRVGMAWVNCVVGSGVCVRRGFERGKGRGRGRSGGGHDVVRWCGSGWAGDAASLGARAERETQRWLEKVVIGLNLCPFAEPAARAGGLRVVACLEEAVDGVVRCVAREAEALAGEARRGGTTTTTTTTLVVCPVCRELDAFEAYLACADEVEAVIWGEGMDLEGVLQVATFHPEYQFAGEDPGDPAAFTNRSPWPTFHLLRETDVGRAADTYPGGTEVIPARNAARLRGMGLDEVERLRRSVVGGYEID